MLGTAGLLPIRGPIEMVELLIDRGADIDRVGRKFDSAGQSPLQLALKHENDAIAQLLRDRGAST